MKRMLLLPHSFQKIGWMLFVPSLLLGLWVLCDNLLLPDSMSVPSIINNVFWRKVVSNIGIIGTTVGAMFIACSRERVEDEMISLERLNALLLALYIDLTLLGVCSLAVYDMGFLTIAFFNLCALPVLFVVIWRIRLCRMRKEVQNEE